MLDDELLKNLHHVLLEVRTCLLHISDSSDDRVTRPYQIHVEEGIMICPNCKHNYPISNGIPNMVGPSSHSFENALQSFVRFSFWQSMK